MTYDVVIAGGGPVALFLACELSLAGTSVLLLEERKFDHSSQGWMDGARGLNFPSTEAFYRRGLLDEVKAASIGWMGGERPGMQFTGEGKASAPPSFTPRFAGHFAGIMLDASKLGVDLRLGHEVTGFTGKENCVAVQTASGEFEAKWLVGCDGGGSTVRKLAGFEFEGTEPDRLHGDRRVRRLGQAGFGIQPDTARHVHSWACAGTHRGG